MDKEYEMLLDALGFERVTHDTLAVRSGVFGEAIPSMLPMPGVPGRVRPYPGGGHDRIDSH
ncbi:MAG: hypothetical protein ACYCT1_00975 [Steroidobacteraceae bacterium]